MAAWEHALGTLKNLHVGAANAFFVESIPTKLLTIGRSRSYLQQNLLLYDG
jgi:hypothetical protein